MQKPWGLATGIGSLPFVESKEAVEFVFNYLPEIPHWPQLPQRGGEEGFVQQYLYPLIKFGLVSLRGEKYFFNNDREDWIEGVTFFYEAASKIIQDNSKDFSDFVFSEDTAKGFYAFKNYLINDSTPKTRFVKGQVSGPVTIGLQVFDSQGIPCFYDEELRDILLQSLAVQALWQIEELHKFNHPIIIFFDDPGICSYGQSSTIGLSGGSIREALAYLFYVVKKAGAQVGVHACAEVDWSLVFEAKPDIINVDMYDYFSSLLTYSDYLTDFLQGGGTLAWGLIPTDAKDLETATTVKLQKKFQEYCEALVSQGVPEKLLQAQWLLTPACGAGTLSMEQTKKLYSFLLDSHKIMVTT